MRLSRWLPAVPCASSNSFPCFDASRFSFRSFSDLFDGRFRRSGPDLFPDRPVLKRIPAAEISFSIDDWSESFTSLPSIAYKKRLPAIWETVPVGDPHLAIACAHGLTG